MAEAAAPAKINLALVVGPSRDDGKHEVATVLQHIALADRISLVDGDGLSVSGFEDDTIVSAALGALAAAAGVEPRWTVEIEKGIPVAAGLGGGSSDAATALRLANELLPDPLSPTELVQIAAAIGADVPFFLRDGPQLGTGDGSELRPLALPHDYSVVLVLPAAVKASTAAVYEAFDRRNGASGFEQRRGDLLEKLTAVRSTGDLAELPANDLASSPVSKSLRDLGALRADVTGAGPCVYGLFAERSRADEADDLLQAAGRTWVTAPVPPA